MTPVWHERALPPCACGPSRRPSRHRDRQFECAFDDKMPVSSPHLAPGRLKATGDLREAPQEIVAHVFEFRV